MWRGCVTSPTEVITFVELIAPDRTQQFRRFFEPPGTTADEAAEKAVGRLIPSAWRVERVYVFMEPPRVYTYSIHAKELTASDKVI